MNLIEAIERAKERMQRSGIEGWGLCLKSEHENLFDEVVMYRATGCDSETCAHNSHGSSAETIKLVPKQGLKLVYLGENGRSAYYLLDDATGEDYIKNVVDGNAGERYFEVVEPQHHHVSYHEIFIDEIPDFILADFESAY